MEKLYDKLIEYSKSRAYPFHMPGHKRQMMVMENPYNFDLTEIDGFDNLHEAEDLLKEAQEQAARLYGSEESHFMVNGSTGGILSAIAGVTHRGDRVLVARNCHTSVYHGIELNGLRPVYLWPELDRELGIYGGITREMVEAMLETYPDIRAVIFTSPTYEGLLSDVRGICDAAHARGIPCIVDEAHGAHLRWIGIPDSVSQGADVTIQSLHKTMPALTQTALIHLNGRLISKARIRRMLTLYQTSSPSYVLMASISKCLDWMETEGTEAFKYYKEQVTELRKRLENLKYLQICRPEGPFDWGKLVISAHTSNMSGRQLYDRLRDEYQLQMEMVSAEYVLAMTTVGDRPEGLQRLAEALEEMDVSEGNFQSVIEKPEPPERALEIDEAVNQPSEKVLLDHAEGRIIGDYLYLYPPGIPLMVPGEVIQMKQIKKIKDSLRQGLDVHGAYFKAERAVTVLSTENKRRECL